MPSLRLFVALSLAALLLALAGGAAPAPRPIQEPGERDVPTVPETDVPVTVGVLTIGEETVPWETFATWVASSAGPELVDGYLRHLLVERAARAAGVWPDAEAVDAAVQAAIDERAQHAFDGDPAGFDAELARVGRTRVGYVARRRLEVAYELAVAALVATEREPDPDAPRALWTERYGRAGRALDLRLLRVGVKHARPPVTATADERTRQRAAERAAALAEADALRARALAGEDLAALCRAHSDDAATRDAGGALAGFTGRGWPAELVDAVYALEPGELSAPLEARGGFWLVRVEGATVTPFDAVADELAREIAARPPGAEEAGIVLDALRAAAEVERSAPPGAFETVDLDAPCLVLDGEPVPWRALARWAMHLWGEMLAPRYAEEALVERRARERGVEITAAEIEQRVDADLARRVRDLFRGEIERWRAELAARGSSEADFRREQRRLARTQLLVEGLLRQDREIGADAVRGLWHERYGVDGKSFEVRLLRMQSQLPETDERIGPEETQRILQRERERITAELEALRARVAAGEDFGALVQRHSDDAETRARGGRLAEGFQPGRWPAEVAAAVAALEPGEVTAPLELSYAYFLFQLLRERRVPFEDVRAELEAELLAARPSMTEISTWLARLHAGSVVRVLPGMFA